MVYRDGCVDMDEVFLEEWEYLCVPTFLEYLRKPLCFLPAFFLLRNRFKTILIVSRREFTAWYGVGKFIYIYICTLYLAISIFL